MKKLKVQLIKFVTITALQLIIIFQRLVIFLILLYTTSHSHAQPTIKIEPVTYGQSIIAPLVSGTSFKLFDWDNDGLTDVLIYQDIYNTGSLPRLIWSRNVGTSTNPRFTSIEQCPVLIESAEFGYFAIGDINNDGNPEIITAGNRERNLVVWRNSGTSDNPEWHKSHAINKQGKIFNPIKDTRSSGGPTLALADLDGDGKLDLILGTNHPSVMKTGFGTNPDEKNPTAGRVYWARNISTNDQIRFEDPEMLTSDGNPIECFGVVYPASLDFDNNGEADILLGDHKPGARLFKNRGTDKLPDFESLGLLNDKEKQPISSFIFTQWDAADLNGDGLLDLVTSSPYNAPNLFHWFQNKDNYELELDGPFILPIKTTPNSPLIGPGISVPSLVDFNNDGVLDLLLGSEPGVPMVAINIGTNEEKIFSPLQRLYFTDGSPIELYSSEIGDGSHHGPVEWYDERVTPRLADWDNDGVPDIISGSQGRRLYWMKGKYIEGELRFEKPQIFRHKGKPILHPHRSLPAVVDWNDNGYLDIVAFLETGFVAVFPGNGTDELEAPIPLMTVDGKHVSPSTLIIEPDINTTLSGRSGIDVADWNDDGLIDLITRKASRDGSVLLHLQDSSGRFEQPIKLLRYQGHLAGPSIIDWNGDGYLDVLLGGDFKRLSGSVFDLPITERAHYYIIYGQSLPVPSVKIKPKN
jgi:hypothetical protein